jgi:hypothetical protein
VKIEIFMPYPFFSSAAVVSNILSYAGKALSVLEISSPKQIRDISISREWLLAL